MLGSGIQRQFWPIYAIQQVKHKNQGENWDLFGKLKLLIIINIQDIMVEDHNIGSLIESRTLRIKYCRICWKGNSIDLAQLSNQMPFLTKPSYFTKIETNTNTITTVKSNRERQTPLSQCMKWLEHKSTLLSTELPQVCAVKKTSSSLNELDKQCLLNI